MATRPEHTDPVLSQMLLDRDLEAAEIAVRQKRLAAMDEAIEAWKRARPRGTSQRSAEVSVEFRGMALPAAAQHALTLVPQGECKTASEILAILERHSIAPQTSQPVKRVQTALNRRREMHGDVVHTGDGRWGLVEWYGPAELRQFENLPDSGRARDTALHAERMKEGIRRAQANGAHYGKPPKITPEQWNRGLEIVAAGVTSFGAIYKALTKLTPEGETDMHRNTLKRHIDRILDGEPYPPSWQAYFESHRTKRAKDDHNVEDQLLPTIAVK